VQKILNIMATMSISFNPGQDVTVTLALSATDPETGPVSSSFTFQTAKGLLGPSSNPTDQSGFANSAQDLFAVTVEPATKAAFVHFFLTSAKGNVVFVNDVNARVETTLAAMERRCEGVFARRDDSRAKGRALYDRFCARAFSDAHVLGHRWCYR
jgi:hypothetical protein